MVGYYVHTYHFVDDKKPKTYQEFPASPEEIGSRPSPPKSASLDRSNQVFRHANQVIANVLTRLARRQGPLFLRGRAERPRNRTAAAFDARRRRRLPALICSAAAEPAVEKKEIQLELQPLHL